jgi:hypothetical protein
MFADARIGAVLQAMLDEIDAPPVPQQEIARRIARPQPARRSASRFYLPAAVAAALAVAILPAVAPGFIQSAQEQIEAILHWKTPPPAPGRVWSAMRSQSATLAAAQGRVSFTIVPPTGLPADVVSEKLDTSAPGIYSKITHSWSLGSPIVFFTYRRAGGRSFMLEAERFDPRAGPPSKYMFEDMDRKSNGREVVVRREHFTWRNGNQVMSATEDEGISAFEIAKIQAAMRGVTIPGVYTPPQAGTTVQQLRIPAP